MICDLNLVRDYVEGKTIEDIEELEDNPIFMMNVIRYTKDKKMVEFCSDKVKNDYKFIKFLVNFFKDDLDFICKIADEFIDKNQDETSFIELNIIMQRLTSKTEYCKKYAIATNIIFETKLFESQLTLSLNKLDLISEGFIVIFDDYNYNKLILNFFAERYIYYILDKFSIERLLHKNFKSFEELKQYGINKYIIELIGQYDEFLADYLSQNLECLNGLNKKLEQISKNWNFYERNLYEEMFSKIMIEYSDFNSPFSYMEILCYFGKKYNFLDKLKDYLDLSDEDIELNIELFTLDKNNLNQLISFNKAKQIILNSLGLIDDDQIGGEQSDKCKIIKLNFKQSKPD